MSSRTAGRPRRARLHLAQQLRVSTGPLRPRRGDDDVGGDAARPRGRSSRGRRRRYARPAPRRAARVRLVTVSVAPCARSVRAARSDILPAPTTSTCRRSKPPKTWRASSTATELTDTGLRAIAVSRRTRRATRNARWKQVVRIGARASVPDGRLVRLLGLPQDLRLAEHQRVEAGGDPEQVVDRLGRRAARRGARTSSPGAATPARRARRSPSAARRASRVVGGGVELDAVAGGQQHRLAHDGQRRQLGERGLDRVRGPTASRSRTATGAVRWETPRTSRSMVVRAHASRRVAKEVARRPPASRRRSRRASARPRAGPASPRPPAPPAARRTRPRSRRANRYSGRKRRGASCAKPSRATQIAPVTIATVKIGKPTDTQRSASRSSVSSGVPRPIIRSNRLRLSCRSSKR